MDAWLIVLIVYLTLTVVGCRVIGPLVTWPFERDAFETVVVYLAVWCSLFFYAPILVLYLTHKLILDRMLKLLGIYPFTGRK